MNKAQLVLQRALETSLMELKGACHAKSIAESDLEESNQRIEESNLRIKEIKDALTILEENLNGD